MPDFYWAFNDTNSIEMYVFSFRIVSLNAQWISGIIINGSLIIILLDDLDS